MVRVRAAAEHGAANAALAKVLAGWLGVPQRSVDLIAGPKSRVKVLRLNGDQAALADLVRARLSSGETGPKDR
jgi:uncharacterized protein YggU (UPF0235/DUF167 family)